jgi:hypothetical protein
VQISSATISTAQSSVPLPESPNTKSILRRRRHARPIGFVAVAAQLAIRMKENGAAALIPMAKGVTVLIFRIDLSGLVFREMNRRAQELFVF